MRVLVADDDEGFRHFVGTVLQRLGCVCDHAVDGRDCVKKIAQHDYNLLLLDLIMSEMDGDQVLHAIKNRFPSMKRVVCSAQDDEQVIRQTLDLGAAAYLTKPITAAMIEEIIEKLRRQTAPTVNEGTQPAPVTAQDSVSSPPAS